MLDSFFGQPSRRARIDFAAAFAELDGLLHGHGLRSAPLTPDLAYARGRLLPAVMATKTFGSDRVARAIISHVSVAPFFASLVMVIHPKPEIDAPMLLADVRVVPSGVTRAYFDACGPGTNDDFDALFRKPLSQTLDAAVASAVRRQRVPEWMASLSSGAGAQVAAGVGRGTVIAYALLRYVERYLEGVERAPIAADPKRNIAAAAHVASVVRANGRGGKMLVAAFGRDFAQRYAALLWND